MKPHKNQNKSILCKQCWKVIPYERSPGLWHYYKKQYCDYKCTYAYLNGQNHHRWVKVPNYAAVHMWIRQVRGKPMVCELCKTQKNNAYQIHWANISREYLRDEKDWARLCIRCHRKYDFGTITTEELLVRLSNKT